MSIPESAFKHWKNVSELIRDKRKKDGLSAQQLADIIGVKATNVYKWESGSRPIDLNVFNNIVLWLNSEIGVNKKVKMETLAEEPKEDYGLKNDDRIIEIMASKQRTIEILATQVQIMQNKITSLEDGKLGNVRRSG